jgi:hypothetical protein
MALTDEIKNKLKAIADAIRGKSSKTEELTLEQMAGAIGELKDDYIANAQSSILQLGLDEEKTNSINTIIEEYYKKNVNSLATFAVWDQNLRGHYGIVYCNVINPFAARHNKGLDFTCDFLLYDHYSVPNNGTEFAYIKNIIFLKVVNLSNYKASAFAYTEDVIGEFTINRLSNENFCTYNNFFCGSKISKIPTIIQNDNITNANTMFGYCMYIKECNKENLEYLNASCNTLFSNCYLLEKVTTKLTPTSITSGFTLCKNLKHIEYLDLINCTSITTLFNKCESLEVVNIYNWKLLNLSFGDSSKLSAESIHNIIQNAVDVADGATARTLSLHATAKTNWQNSEYYDADLVVLEQKGITIA